MKKLLLIGTITLSSALMLAGCNTIQGAGKDLKKTGQAIEHAAMQSKAEKMLSKKVMQRINRHSSLRQQVISATANGSTVTLRGHVKNAMQRKLAAKEAYRVEGVKKVIDHIMIR